MLQADPVNQTERLYKIEQMLSESGVVPITTLLERLEISRATFKRDLDYLRDHLGVHGRLAGTEFSGIYEIEADSRAKLASESGEVIATAGQGT